MRRNLHKQHRNIAQKMKVILLILFFTLIVYTLCSVAILHKVAQQTLQEIEQMSGLYTDELDDRFMRVSRELFSTIMKKNQADSYFWNYVNLIKENSPNTPYAVKRLRENTLSYTWEYGEAYNFFIYLENTDQFYLLSLSEDGSYSATSKQKEMILKHISKIKDTTYSVKKKWNILKNSEETCMCKIAQNQDVYFGCFVDVKSILQPFSSLVLRDNGYVRLVNSNGDTVSELTLNGIHNTDYKNDNNSLYSIKQMLSQAPFYIQMNISEKDILNFTMGSLVLLLSVAAVLIIAGAIILIYLKNNLMAPVQRFVTRLEEYDKGGYIYELTEENLLELEQIDEKFHRMISQIQKLKITLYEKELQKKKIEMDYLNLQIRPHFYLNCLNFIYSMINFGQYAVATQMTTITAEYLRYIFQSNKEKVPVTAETQHCEDYLKILLLRYPERFEYYIEVHDEVKDAVIFPFLIQVFIENAAKHMLTLERKILISVTVYPEDIGNEKYVNIYISDTGNGYSEEILKQLNQKHEIDEKLGHVGINNVLRRFQYYYNEKGKIDFSNSPLGGAVVDIHIPYTSIKEVQ